MRTVLKPALCLLISFCCTTAAAAPSMSGEQALRELKVAKAQNGKRLAEIEVRIKSLVAPLGSQPALNGSYNVAEIETLAEQRQEHIWRQDLIDRLMLQIDSRFKNGDLREFLCERLVEMAKADLLEPTGNRNLWKQMTYLSQALRQIPERGENIIGFIDGYLKDSTFKQPLQPEQYMRSREYSNGGEHVAAASASKDQVGELVEQRVMLIEGNLNDSPISSPAN